MKTFSGLVLAALLMVSASSVADVNSSVGDAGSPGLYRVKPGDTLWDISEEYYGTPDVWGKISKENNVPVPIHLQPGKVLNLDALMPPVPESFPGIVTHLTGAVWHVEQGRQRQPLAMGDDVQVGSLLETSFDGFVAVAFADGARITLPSRTRVTLEKREDGRGVSVMLAEGRVESRIPRTESGKPHFDVVTPTGNLGVRGTHFRVAYNDATATYGEITGTTVSVLEGLVDASFNVGQTGVAAGQGAWESEGEFGVVELLPSPRLHSSSEGLNDSLELMLSQVPKAELYRVKLATDADFFNVVQDVSSPNHQLEISGLDEGLYYLHLTAIDSNGVEGMPSVEMLYYHPVGAQVSYRQGEWIFNWNSRPRSSYRLELSASSDFSHLIVDREMTSSKGAYVRNLPEGDYFWRLSVSHDDEEASHVVGTGQLNAEARSQ
ncbi:FecR domain-containing protein [Halomonas halocynthiae]|uniref:FecR domain-containing protein n=1 Tax=Halomonas halocynthiae TaxID=176290 RepID=UPI0003F54A63|nr:FecR domain-containing protein [Halomonas halocynthiae]